MLAAPRDRKSRAETAEASSSTFACRLQSYTFQGTPTAVAALELNRSSTSNSFTRAPNPSRRAAPLSTSREPKAKATAPPISTKRKATTTTITPSASPAKKKRLSSSYAPPSKYTSLPNLLTDSLAPNLICVFIGVNPGIRTATTGHAYSHPSNLFWKLLYSSGCTPRLCKASECHDLPHLYALGNTNIVARATKDASELSKQEMDEGVEVLEEKMRLWRPEAVGIVGKSIWEALWRVRHGKKISKEEFSYGWQDEKQNMGVVDGEWKGARVFVATTTSGLAAGMRPHEKEEVWRGLGEWVRMRRKEKGIPDEGGVKVPGGESIEEVAEEAVQE